MIDPPPPVFGQIGRQEGGSITCLCPDVAFIVSFSQSLFPIVEVNFIKGCFAQLLEQNHGFLYQVDTFLRLPCSGS